MKYIAAALIAATAQAGAASYASKVCVSNMAGFVLHWWMDDLITGNSSSDSGSYPIDQTRCMDIAGTLNAANLGDFIEVYVHAALGETKTCNSAIIYQASPAVTASFTCTGTTLNFGCSLNGQAYLQELEAAGMYEELYAFAAENNLEYTPAVAPEVVQE